MDILAIGVALILVLAVIGIVARKWYTGKAARDEAGKAAGSQQHGFRSGDLTPNPYRMSDTVSHHRTEPTDDHRIIADRVYAAIDGERQRLGLPKLMRNSVLGENALKLLLEADRKSDFVALNADYRRRIQSADYPRLIREASEPLALLYQKDWQPDTPIDQVAAMVADGVLEWARENRRDHDTEELYWPDSFGALLDEAAQDISMATSSSIPDPLPGIQIMIGVGAADYSSAVISRINKARVSAGVAPLVLDSFLREIVRNYFAMDEVPAPGQLGRDLTRFGYTDGWEIRGAAMHRGVNPIQIPYYADTGMVHFEDIVAYLTDSLLKDYRDTLLNPDFQDIGVAVSVGRGLGDGLDLTDVYSARAEFVIGYRKTGNQSA